MSITPKKDAPQAFTVDFADVTYNIPAYEDWPTEATELEEDGKPLQALKAVLGDDQYKTLRKVAKTNGKMAEFNEALYKKLSEVMGVDQGE